MLRLSWDAPFDPPEVGLALAELEDEDPEVDDGAATEGVPLVGPAVATAPTPPVTGPLSESCRGANGELC